MVGQEDDDEHRFIIPPPLVTPALEDVREAAVEAGDGLGGARVGADSEGIGPLAVEQVGGLAQLRRDLVVQTRGCHGSPRIKTGRSGFGLRRGRGKGAGARLSLLP